MTIFVFALAVSVCARADSYEFFALDSSSGSYTIEGITASGTAVIHPSGCNDTPTSLCYRAYTAGEPSPVLYNSLADFDFDNGTHCAIDGAVDSIAACNGDHEVYLSSSPSPLGGLFDGPEATDEIFAGPIGGGVVLNAEGDVVFDSLISGTDVNTLGIDLTSRLAQAPEPSSLALLGTAVLGAIAVGSRRQRLCGIQRYR